ncbi:MAG: sodium-dependent transporter [Prevotella sp.]|nr:sodium-dependent transporter [Prevotella sp.]MBR6319730.1 sodium-dependent transporter [Prevotella sp.]
MNDRRGFATRLGVILATAGSAVGLGNVWRFPYVAGENGGAAFILVYIGCILLLGIPGMLSEFIIGRRAQRNAARSYRNFSRYRTWRFVGYLGILTSSIILGFYAVVAGWCLQYLWASLLGGIKGDAAAVADYFNTFASNPWKPALWAVAFILLTHLVVVRGVEKGIERASKVLMPLLFVLLVVIVIASCMLPGGMEGVRFVLQPDFSKLSHGVLLDALGQAFFSLSLGTACLCTYASYFSRDTNLLRSACQIAFIDLGIAILAGLMIFPAVFSVGVEPAQGPSLIFITLPSVFQQAFAGMGQAIAVLFYALLVFAALTSTISMHEIGTAFFTEEHRLPRQRAAWLITSCCSVLAVLCSLSVGAVEGIGLMGLSLMDFCDQLTAKFMLPAGALLTSIFIGWFANQQVVRNEFTNRGTVATSLFPAYQFAVRFVLPILIVLIFLRQTGII